MDQRAEARGAHIRGVYYRRVLWLLAIGCVHAYLIWSGDILVLYAECGLLLYFFRNLAPRTLIILGIAALFYLVPILLGITAGIDSTKDYFRARDARVQARQQAGQLPEPRDRAGADRVARLDVGAVPRSRRRKSSSRGMNSSKSIAAATGAS